MMTGLVSAAPSALDRDPMVGLRLGRVDGFEPAIALGSDELPVYLRRFTMLFADDATMRRGGIGRVTRAVNAQGEAVALKQLILPTRDEFDDDAAHEALVAKFKAAFREEYECHRALSGLKGFPRLYGWGEGIVLFSKNYQVTTRHKSKGKMHCPFRQCILNVATGCHFTDPIALRLSLSTDLPTNLLFVLSCKFFIKSIYYRYFIIVGTRMFISTGFAT